MSDLLFPYFLLQVETVGPEGLKIQWILLLVLIIVSIFLFSRNKKKIKFPNFSSALSVGIHKNSIYHPTVITLNIQNKSKKAVVIQNPVIRFKKGRKVKAFKIKAVNSSQIYPLYIDAGRTHNLPVTLQAFYDFDTKLKRFSRVRIEFNFEDNKSKQTRYLLLMPTLFRKAKR